MLPLQRPYAAADIVEPLVRALAHRKAALLLGLACTGVALVLGLGMATVVPADVMAEGGPVEAATAWCYVAAAMIVLFTRLPALTGIDKAAICLLLLAFAAREADLHTALFEISILKASFYRRHGTPGQIVAALCILLPVLLAFLLLLRRHGPRWLVAPSRWRGPVVTVTTFAVLMLVAKMFDRLPAVVVDLRILEAVPDRVRHVLLSLEEVLELGMPLLAILAVAQGRLPARLSRAG